MCLLLIFSSLILYYYYDYELENDVGNKIENKLIQIDYNKKLVSFLSQDEFDNFYYIYNIYGEISNKKVKIEERLDNLDIELGKNKINSNEIIVTSDIVDNKYKINDIVEIKINNKKYSFKIVGITASDYEKIYVSNSDLIKIVDENEYEPLYINALIKEYKNVTKIINELLSKGYNAGLVDTSREKEVNSLIELKDTSKKITYVLLLIVILFILNIIKDMYKNEEKNILLLKTLGYKRSIITTIIFIRVLIVLTIGYLLLTFIFSIGIATNLIMKEVMIKGYKMSILISLILVIVLNEVYLWRYFKKMKKMNIMEIF